MANLLDQITDGVRSYSDAPLWEEVKVFGKVKVDDKQVRVSSSQYGHSLAIVKADGSVCYIKLRSNADHTKKEFTVADFTATRDSSSYGVNAGDMKRMAY